MSSSTSRIECDGSDSCESTIHTHGCFAEHGGSGRFRAPWPAKQLEAARMRRAADEVLSTWPIRRWLTEYANLLDPPDTSQNSQPSLRREVTEGCEVSE
jgi:hypothetical protein